MILFIASHLVPLRPHIRGWLVVRMGPRIFSITYGTISIAILAWLIAAAAKAPYVRLWSYQEWHHWVPWSLMPIACLLAVLGLARANPLSFGGRKEGQFDPERPGIAGVTRHPILLAIILWSLAHIVATGRLSYVVLFGMFLCLGLFGMVIIDRRKQRQWGEPVWRETARQTAFLSARGIRHIDVGVKELVGAFILFAALVYLHRLVIGVDVIHVVL